MPSSVENRESGWIFDIKKFSIHDGPGIRTTVFLKGCPLRCLWCDNPESQQLRPQIVFWEGRCIGCDACLEACTRSAIMLDEQGRRSVSPDRCDFCGKCLDECYSNALDKIGRLVTVEDLLSIVEADSPFYEQSDGGITLSGGEPTVQPAFALSILEGAHRRGIHTAIESCGHAPWDVWQAFLPHLDLILYDLKEIDPANHERWTGVSNELILANLRRLVDAGADIVIRRPVIPGYNDYEESIRALAHIVSDLKEITEIHLLPYHRLGESKYGQLRRAYPMGDHRSLDDADVEALRDIVVSYGLKVKIGG
jgi:pyruvate formate lyase activating enzyme